MFIGRALNTEDQQQEREHVGRILFCSLHNEPTFINIHTLKSFILNKHMSKTWKNAILTSTVHIIYDFYKLSNDCLKAQKRKKERNQMAKR